MGKAAREGGNERIVEVRIGSLCYDIVQNETSGERCEEKRLGAGLRVVSGDGDGDGDDDDEDDDEDGEDGDGEARSGQREIKSGM